jgi:hypothetical protein
MQVEFVDRYTGDPRGRPTEFNACRECEAMGCYPTQTAQFDEEPDEDGWWWVHCQACDGTGRVPLWRGLLRVPRWLWKGIPFIWNTRRFNPPPEGVSMAANMWMAFKCAYMVDMGLWSPETHRWKWRG